ncbi:MAG: hypothetical protein DHS80DRAFT_29060 [Piptocephalis tieghemiana]|nr:MAG: hypothetical protein DHS80DRAFT_29060 [Piptocephalis tieghemiana]
MWSSVTSWAKSGPGSSARSESGRSSPATTSANFPSIPSSSTPSPPSAEQVASAISGFDLLLDDNISQAMAILEPQASSSPVHALGHGMGAFITAMLGFEESDLSEAQKRLTATESMALARAKKFRKHGFHEDALGCEIIAADCDLMAACTMFVRESVLDYAKGIYKLRRAHNAYDSIYKSLHQIPPASSSSSRGPSLDMTRQSSSSSVTSSSSSSSSSSSNDPDRPSLPSRIHSIIKRQSVDGRSSVPSPKDQAPSLSSRASMDTPSMSHSISCPPSPSASSSSSSSSSQPHPSYEEAMATEGGSLAIGGILMGRGLFSLILSLLPQRASRALSALGYRGDRAEGLHQLRVCAGKPQDVHAPLAALALLTYHTALAGFLSYPSAPATRFSEAQELCTRMRSRYPRGRLWLLMQGRLLRLSSRLDQAISLLGDMDSDSSIHNPSSPAHPTDEDEEDEDEEELDLDTEVGADDHVTKHLMQLEYLIEYELGWCCITTADYSRAADLFIRLSENSNWSRAFYTYIAATCLLASGAHEEAKDRLTRVPSLLKKRFGGRLIPAEQYVQRCSKSLLRDWRPWSRGELELPILELALVWNIYGQMSSTRLERITLSLCDVRHAPFLPSSALIRGCASRELADFQTAQRLLCIAGECSMPSQDSTTATINTSSSSKKHTLVQVHAWFELAVMACQNGEKWDEAKAWLDRVEGESEGIDFENRLGTKARLLREVISEKSSEKAGEEEGKSEVKGKEQKDDEKEEEEKTNKEQASHTSSPPKNDLGSSKPSRPSLDGQSNSVFVLEDDEDVDVEEQISPKPSMISPSPDGKEE